MIYCYLPYTLSLHAPAVFRSVGGDRNGSRTLPFIPGAALRGAAAQGLGAPGKDAARVERFRKVIIDGTVRFLNAYPRAGERRTLPAPLSLQIDKESVADSAGEISAWDLAAFTEQSDEGEASWPGASLSKLAEPFISIGSAQPLRVAPPRGGRIHQQRDRARGRAWKEERNGHEVAYGAVFAYEYLDAGQEFDGLIQFQAEDQGACEGLIATVKDALGSRVLLGRSRRGGYGGDATISWGRVRDREVEGQGIVSTDLPSNVEFRALLTSACIIRDPHTGQIDPARLADEIEERLGGRAKVVARRWSFELVGGFNRKWSLELPQALACAAGSVLILRSIEPIPLADLLAIEHAGFGERTVEGLGRVVFLHSPARTLILRMPPQSSREAPTGAPPELVRFVEGRILDEAVERTIEREAERIAESAKSPPSTSLLGRLRTAMRADPPVALATLQAWLADEGPHRLRRPALEQLDRCRVGNERLTTWLREMSGGRSHQPLTTLLRLDTLAQRWHVVSEATAGEHWERRAPWLRARVIDSTFAALARRQRQRRQS
jgi:CRISPR-associated protein Csx10